MRCSRFRKMSVTFDGVSLPAELAAHSASCAGCREFFARSEAVRRLVALKRYEHPEPARLARNRAVIHQVLVEEAYRRETEAAAAPAAGRLALPFLRYGLATAFLAMIAVQILVVPPLSTVDSTLPAPIQPPRMLAAARTAPTNVAPASFFTAAPAPAWPTSGIAPAAIQYGTRPSALAGFEY